MKKFAWASILLALVLSLSACGGKPTTPTSSLNADSAISSVAMDITDLDALTTTYLNPLCMTNVLTENWNDPSELAPHQLAFFYLSARVAKGDDENVKWSTTAFPASEVDTAIQAYFDVTAEHLHSNDEVQNYYDAKTDTYTFEAFGAPLAQKIVKAGLSDNMLTLNYEFYSRADDTTVVREGTLLVKIDGDSFKYLSCSTAEKSEEITDTEARELYTQAVEEIILLATEDPISVIKSILGDDITVIYEEKNMDGKVYYETSAQYQELQDYYSNIFFGDALGWILSTKFANVEGTLYCSPTGGATGWNISNLEITRTDPNKDTYLYNATFSEFEKKTTSSFAIEQTNQGYRITSIDYIPELLKN